MKHIKQRKKKQLIWTDDFSLDSDNVSINNHNSVLKNPYVRYTQLIKGSKLEWNSK